MIERHFIEVFGTTYMVEIETLEKVENKAVEKVSEQKILNEKFLKTVLKTAPYSRIEKSGI